MAVAVGGQWSGVGDVVAGLGLSVDAEDTEAVVAAVREGMIKQQNTVFYEHWVSAYKFLQGLDDVDSDDELEIGDSGSGTVRELVHVPGQLVAHPGAGSTALFDERQFRDLLKESASRALAPIAVRVRRRTYTLSAVTALVVFIWGFPQMDNPLLAGLSPYHVVTDAEGSDRTLFEPLKTSVWGLLLLFSMVLWFSAWRRQSHEATVVADLHEPYYHAEALQRLTRDETFTQLDFEAALVDRRDVIPHPSRLAAQRSVPVGFRIAASAILAAIAFGVVVATVVFVGESAYDDDPLPTVTLVGCGAVVVLSAFGFAALWLDERHREALVGVLRLRPYEETLTKALHAASELALDRFVTRGTISPTDDHAFLPTYRFTGPAVRSTKATIRPPEDGPTSKASPQGAPLARSTDLERS